MSGTPRDPAGCRVLLLHDDPYPYLETLRTRFPGVRLEICTRVEDVDGALASVRPQAVFSVKCRGIPGPVHRKLVEWLDVEWIHVAGAGFEHLLPVERCDLTVTNSTGVLSPFMAETVLGAMLMLNTGFHVYREQQREHLWQQNGWTALGGKTALIIGLGEIGRRVARHARHMGMHVLGMRSRPGTVDEVHELVRREDLHPALARADVLCVHVPLVDSTRNLLDADAFKHMKPGIIIVNTARGGVMDEDALRAALEERRVAAAHLDVFATEPLPESSPLWDTPNLVITPHMADSVSDWPSRFAAFFGDNLERWLAGKPLLKVVDPQRGY